MHADLKVENDGPHKTERQFSVSIDNLVSMNVHQANLHRQTSHCHHFLAFDLIDWVSWSFASHPTQNSSYSSHQSKFCLASTKWVEVYLKTHCNIDSKKAFPTGVLDRWNNCLLIYWRNVAQLPRPHQFVYLCVMTQRDVHGDRQRLPKIWVGTFLVRSVHPRKKTLNWF